ncbi:hypothetical protein DM02DRAFT_503837, partial [Periconia macrospinosa]
ALLVVTCALMTMGWIMVLARIRIRFEGKTIARDDYIMVAGLLFFTMFGVYIYCAIDSFILSPNVALDWTPNERGRAGLYYYLAQVTYTLATVSIRFSIGLSLLRIARTRWHRVILYITLWVMIVTALLTGITLVTLATDIQTQFEVPKVRNRIGILRVMIFVFSGASAAEDIAILLMPYFILYDLQRNKAEKRGLLILLMLGGVAIVANMARIPFLPGISNSGPESRLGLFFCSMFELGLGIVAGSAVTLR